MKQRLTIAAVLFLAIGLAGADNFKALAMGAMSVAAAWSGTVANIGVLINNPIMRLIFVLAGLRLFGLAASRLGDRMEASAEAEQSARSALMTEFYKHIEKQVGEAPKLIRQYATLDYLNEAKSILLTDVAFHESRFGVYANCAKHEQFTGDFFMAGKPSHGGYVPDPLVAQIVSEFSAGFDASAPAFGSPALVDPIVEAHPKHQDAIKKLSAEAVKSTAKTRHAIGLIGLEMKRIHSELWDDGRNEHEIRRATGGDGAA